MDDNIPYIKVTADRIKIEYRDIRLDLTPTAVEGRYVIDAFKIMRGMRRPDSYEKIFLHRPRKGRLFFAEPRNSLNLNLRHPGARNNLMKMISSYNMRRGDGPALSAMDESQYARLELTIAKYVGVPKKNLETLAKAAGVSDMNNPTRPTSWSDYADFFKRGD